MRLQDCKQQLRELATRVFDRCEAITGHRPAPQGSGKHGYYKAGSPIFAHFYITSRGDKKNTVRIEAMRESPRLRDLSDGLKRRGNWDKPGYFKLVRLEHLPQLKETGDFLRAAWKASHSKA